MRSCTCLSTSVLVASQNIGPLCVTWIFRRFSAKRLATLSQSLVSSPFSSSTQVYFAPECLATPFNILNFCQKDLPSVSSKLAVTSCHAFCLSFCTAAVTCRLMLLYIVRYLASPVL